MASYTLIVSPIARDDLKDIHQYGVRNWGVDQAASYLDLLKSQFWLLTEHPRMGIDRATLAPAMRSLSVGSHVVFYRLQAAHIEIVRILHGRQDPQRHIK
jgi:toxin ParE1/3/4